VARASRPCKCKHNIQTTVHLHRRCACRGERTTWIPACAQMTTPASETPCDASQKTFLVSRHFPYRCHCLTPVYHRLTEETLKMFTRVISVAAFVAASGLAIASPPQYTATILPQLDTTDSKFKLTFTTPNAM